MLKIRSEQIRPFEPQAEQAFIRRVMNYVREKHGEAEVRLPKLGAIKVSDLRDETLSEMVKGGVARARGYKIEWASNLIAFVVVMFVVAPNFDEDERAAKFLKDEAVAVEERVDKMLDELTDEEWEEIAEKYDAETWQMPIKTSVAEEMMV